ncbi:MAG: serine/threonine protein kinase [Sandaracinaceae bacterium]
MTALIGKEIDGRYRLASELGEGAMGVVFRAEKLDGTGTVAIKILNDDCSEDADLRERFEREARALFGLQHPHILGVLDYGVADGRMPYLVMEFLEGKSFDAVVDDEGLTPSEGYEVARQFLEGLAFAHSQGVLHRDLKTENLFAVRKPDGSLQTKLLDFGLVKFVDDERWGEGKKLTVAGSVMGSPAYMSPEQGTGSPMDARSDVYSAGVVVYELITGSWPFETESRMEMLKAHLLEPVPSLSEGREGLKAQPLLDVLLRKAMAKERKDRFADAGEMLAAFEAVPSPRVWLDPALQSAGAKPAGSLPAPPMGNIAAPAFPSPAALPSDMAALGPSSSVIVEGSAPERAGDAHASSALAIPVGPPDVSGGYAAGSAHVGGAVPAANAPTNPGPAANATPSPIAPSGSAVPYANAQKPRGGGKTAVLVLAGLLGFCMVTSVALIVMMFLLRS